MTNKFALLSVITAALAMPALLLAEDPAPSPASTNSPAPLVSHDIPGIRGKISVPGNWTYLPGQVLEGDLVLAVREKISNENDPWTTGLSMSLDRNGAADSGMKAGEYAMSIAREAREKAGDEASPITESTNGVFHDIRFDFPVQSDEPMQVTEVLRANEQTGTVAVILWQSPKEEASSLQSLRDDMITQIALDPAQ